MLNSPDKNDSQQSSVNEIGVKPLLAPLFCLEPYQLDGEKRNSELQRVAHDQSQLSEYYNFELAAYKAVCLQIEVPDRIVMDIEKMGHDYSYVVSQDKKNLFDDYMQEKGDYFVSLRSLGTYPDGMITILESLEQCTRNKLLIDLINFEEFAEQVNNNHISIPHVTPKVKEVWAKRKDIPETKKMKIKIEMMYQNRNNLIAAIEEQIFVQYYAENPVFAFASQYGIDIISDIQFIPKFVPRLAKPDTGGEAVQHISEAGAVYMSFGIDYCEGDMVRAVRSAAVILPGNRTELAYWTKAAHSKTLNVHKGRGRLIIGNPVTGVTRVRLVDSNKVHEVVLPARCFYTLQADNYSTEPFVVSGYYEPPPDWSKLEILLKPGEDTVSAPEGKMKVPSDFRAVCMAAAEVTVI
jgi:hypothetical protein